MDSDGAAAGVIVPSVMRRIGRVRASAPRMVSVARKGSAIAPEPRPAWRILLAPVATGLAARLLWIAWTTPVELSLDETRFWDLATRRMEGTAFIPPLYPLTLALIRFVLGEEVATVRIVGACLCVVTIPLVYRLATRHMGPWDGLVPAWIAALLPIWVHYDGRIRSEGLVILLLLVFADLWTVNRDRPTWRILVAGLTLGLVALARPEFLVLPLVIAVLDLARSGGLGSLRKAALLLPGIVLVVLPWAARNRIALGVSAPISANGGYNFWKSFNPMTDGSQIPVDDFSLWENVAERDADAVGYREGWRYVREHPLRSVFLIPAKWGHLFGPERGLLSDMRRYDLTRRDRMLTLLLAVAQNLIWFLLLALGLFALIGPLRSGVKDAALAVLLSLLLVHAVFFGDDRFHLPLLPFLCAILPEAWDGSLRPARRLRMLGLVLAAEAIVWISILIRDLGRIATIWRA